MQLIEAPKIEVDENISSQILRIKDQWKVEVKYKGYPKPKILWTKNGERIDENKCKIYYDDWSSSSTIAVYSLEKEHSGTYSVTAINVAGSSTVDFQLKIIGNYRKILFLLVQKS